MAEHYPLADRISNEADAFFNLWKNRRWLAVILLISILGFSIFSTIGWFKRGTQVDALKSENRELQRDLRQIESENKGLRETVAPLLARAAKEFPGEEINISLKKIVERLEQQDPLRQPIASCTATVTIYVKSDEQVNSHFIDRGGYVAIARGSEAILQASSHESWGKQTGQGVVVYRGVFSTPADSSAVGKPIKSLMDGQYLQIEFAKMPENAVVTKGKVIFVLNDLTRLEFNIPEQRATDRQIFVRELSAGMKPLASKFSGPKGRAAD
jgi:hypothetical protein